jgi:hypothetical protein
MPGCIRGYRRHVYAQPLIILIEELQRLDGISTKAIKFAISETAHRALIG